MNQEESILKQSLVVTGKLVGVFAVWVTLVSLLAVTITGRAVGSASGAASSADKTNAAPAEVRTAPRNAPATGTAKPNG